MARGPARVRRLRGEPGGVYNLASGVETTIRELAETDQRADRQPDADRARRRRATGTTRASASATRRRRARELGFEATTPLRDGLERTIAWTRENLRLHRRAASRSTPSACPSLRSPPGAESARAALPGMPAREVEFERPRCASCGWVGDVLDGGVVDLLARRDRESTLFRAYTELYERIAEDDIDTPIQGDELLDLEASRLLEALGPIDGAAVCDVGVGRGASSSCCSASARDCSSASTSRRRTSCGSRRTAATCGWCAQCREPAVPRGARRNRGVRRARARAQPRRLPREHLRRARAGWARARKGALPRGHLAVPARSAGCPYEMVAPAHVRPRAAAQGARDAGLQPERTSYSGFYPGRWQPWLRQSAQVRLPG